MNLADTFFESRILGRCCGVLGDRIVRHYQHQDAVVERAPTQDAVLTEGPLFVEATFQVHQVAALPEPHLVGKTSQLVKVRRVVGDTPNTRLREIIKFHSFAQMCRYCLVATTTPS
jgi:hypothetical protein